MGYCAVLTTGEVDCWGYGPNGELGNGQFYATAPFGSAIPVAVDDEAGDGGVLSDAASVTGGDDGYCAVLTSSEVDCWGAGTSALPVVVDGVDGNGVLFGVVSVTGDATGGYCALLTSGTVACWGKGGKGELGNGVFADSALPVAVDGLGGDGALSGVADVTADQDGFCALLTTGGVDCWGNGTFGLLGNGKFSNSALPVQVGGVVGGLLHRATGLTGDGTSFCALLNSTDLACWGAGPDGDLGNGQFYSSGSQGSATPVQVQGLGGIGALSTVAGVTGGGDGYCALLGSGEVDCWGADDYGNLGNGQFTPSSPFGSATPVQVL
jgi:alpha-tubulin suppressor-like RCC1 family protein